MLLELSLDPLLDQELEGCHRDERVLNTEVPYIWYLDDEDVRLHQLRNASASNLRGYVSTLSPSHCYASPR